MLFTFTKYQDITYPIVKPSDCPLVKCQCRQQAKVKYLALEVFELPFLMLSCKTCTQCQSCDQFAKRSFSKINFDLFENGLFIVYIWLRTNIGAILAATLMYFAYGHFSDLNQQKQDYLVAPNVNDFYFVDLMHWKKDTHPFYRYTALKVTEVNDENVTVLIGNMMHRDQVSARTQIGHDKPMYRGFFTQKTLEIPRYQLLTLFNDEVIYDVRRPTNLYIDGSIVVKYAAD